MRNIGRSLAFLAGVGFFAVGCSGPEQKLGRGINNLTEFARGGEIRHSMEQSYLFDNPDTAYTTGFIRGVNKSFVRTVVGMFEVLTFPIPGYEPYIKPGNYVYPEMTEHPIYPNASKPGFFADPSFTPDNALGFGGGDVAPFIPGSKFSIFDY